MALNFPLLIPKGDDQHPLLMRLAAAVLECQVVARLPTIALCWKSPVAFRDSDSDAARNLIDGFFENAKAAGPRLRQAVHGGVREAWSMLPADGIVATTTTVEQWAEVILQRIDWQTTPFGSGAPDAVSNVVDIGVYALSRMAQRPY